VFPLAINQARLLSSSVKQGKKGGEVANLFFNESKNYQKKGKKKKAAQGRPA